MCVCACVCIRRWTCNSNVVLKWNAPPYTRTHSYTCTQTRLQRITYFLHVSLPNLHLQVIEIFVDRRNEISELSFVFKTIYQRHTSTRAWGCGQRMCRHRQNEWYEQSCFCAITQQGHVRRCRSAGILQVLNLYTTTLRYAYPRTKSSEFHRSVCEFECFRLGTLWPVHQCCVCVWPTA